MPDTELLGILRQGGEAWSRWRGEHFDISPDLTNADLRGFRPGKTNFHRVNLANADFREADLSYSTFEEAVLDKADMRGALMSNVQFDGASMISAVLSDAVLSNSTFAHAKLDYADLRRAEMRSAVFDSASLVSATMSEAILEQASFKKARLSGSDLTRFRAIGADFYAADLRAARLMGANLERAYLGKAKLDRADFTDAILFSTDFAGAHMRGTLLQADISEALNVPAVAITERVPVLGFDAIRGPNLYFGDDILEHMTALSKGNVDGVALRRLVPIDIWLAESNTVGGELVASAVSAYMEAAGFEILAGYPAEIGSFKKRLVARSVRRLSKRELEQRVEELAADLKALSTGELDQGHAVPIDDEKARAELDVLYATRRKLDSETCKNYVDAGVNLLKALGLVAAPAAALMIGTMIVRALPSTKDLPQVEIEKVIGDRIHDLWPLPHILPRGYWPNR
jgi:uncharacterized protein YjbI with pentapeptide repeats